MQSILVRPARTEDQPEWLRLRAALWPATPAEDHAQEISAFLTGNLSGWLLGLHDVAVFVAVRPTGGLCGFLEASVRPLADGCTTHPVGYVEGWYVDADVRRQGVGRRLVEAGEAWAAARGCREMASDAHADNPVSRAAHQAVGFLEEASCVRFRKWLPASGDDRKAGGPTVHRLTLLPLEGSYAVCRLDVDAPLPAWAGGAFVSVTRTADESSLVCRQEAVPSGVACERGWRCLRVADTLDFSLVGVLESLLRPLAVAGISVFVVSTFDTDYLFLREGTFLDAVRVLRRAGHAVRP
jgi:GNAT superfamily N-acetyltransferase